MNGLVPVYLGLGSNLGDRLLHIERALFLLAGEEGMEIEKVSGMYETAPRFFENQPEFINAAAEARTSLRPGELLSLVKRVERKAGRKENFRHGPRVIDIDILLYGRDIISGKGLDIPHPGVVERLFVLFPLAEIAGGAIHPLEGRTIRGLLEDMVLRPT